MNELGPNKRPSSREQRLKRVWSLWLEEGRNFYNFLSFGTNETSHHRRGNQRKARGVRETREPNRDQREERIFFGKANGV